MQILQIYISMVNTWINKSLKKAPVFARSCTAENCANDAEAYLLSFLCEFTEWSWREDKMWNSAGGMHTMWLNQCTLKSTVYSVELHTYLTFYTFSVWTIIVLHHLEFCALKKKQQPCNSKTWSLVVLVHCNVLFWIWHFSYTSREKSCEVRFL